MPKVIRCEFCNSIIQPDDPFYEHGALKLNKKDLEEIRKFLAFTINDYGIFSKKDNASDYIVPQKILEIYKTLNKFLMK